MEKAQSSKLYEQASKQDKEADSHAHKMLTEVSAWFNTSMQAGHTRTEAFLQNMSEHVDAANTAVKHDCDTVSKGLHALKEELKREDPEMVTFLHKAQHAPEKAVHRVADFYKTRPLIAAMETIIPPVAIIDGLMRGGLPQQKVVRHPAPENTQS